MQNETAKENLLRQIREYRPYNEQEERDKNLIFQWIEQHEGSGDSAEMDGERMRYFDAGK